MSGWGGVGGSAGADGGVDDDDATLALASLHFNGGGGGGSNHASPLKSYSAFGGGGGGAFGGGLFFNSQPAPTSHSAASAGSGWDAPHQQPQQQQAQLRQPMPHASPFGMGQPQAQTQAQAQPHAPPGAFHRDAFDPRASFEQRSFGSLQAQQPQSLQQRPPSQQQMPSFSSLSQQQPHAAGPRGPLGLNDNGSAAGSGGNYPAGKSILSEVMSLMQPQNNNQQSQPQQMPPHLQSGGSFGFSGIAPPPPQQQRPFAGPPMQQQPPGLRPPLPIGARGPMSVGPPGFKAPPGFSAPQPPLTQVQQPIGAFPGSMQHQPSQQQVQQQQMQQQPLRQQPPPGIGSGGAAPSAPAPFVGTSSVPSQLQHDSHVQCSLCRVIVQNTPQALYMHDHSPQHIQNDLLRHQQQRQQQQQQQQRDLLAQTQRGDAGNQQQQQQQPALPFQQQSQQQQQKQAPSSQQPQQSGPQSSSAAPASAPALDLNWLQSQLRAFMVAQEDAKARGLPPLNMDAQLISQLKLMQQMNGRPSGMQPSPPQQQSGQEQDGQLSATAKAAAETAAAVSSGTVASGGHQYPSRAALIAAASEVHLLPSRRLSLKRGPHLATPASLEGDLRRMLATLQPDPETFKVREQLRAQCEQLVQSAWGADRCTVRLFGSSVNTLCETHSDVDLCLIMAPAADDAPLDKPAIVEKLALLLNPYMKEILALPKARVPIVKFTAPSVSLHCDIGINNNLACRNSELIRDYMRIDSRARDMCLVSQHSERHTLEWQRSGVWMVIKHWAKMRKINDTYRGTLSSYCYVLMVIHYLQSAVHCNPPVLPCLQSAGRTPDQQPVLIDGFDCWYNTDISQFANFGAANKSTLADLLVSGNGAHTARVQRSGGARPSVGFFRLYSHEFDFKELILSIRTGGYLDKKKKVWGQSAKKDRHLLCVEDPFDVTHNLGRGCDPTALYEIRGEFMRAFSVLREGGSIFDVCVAYTKQFRGA